MTKYLFLEYPKCSTCQKAKSWLEQHHITFEDRHIVEQNPTAAELTEWYKKSGLPLKSFFNTSGLLYKSMNGMLVKRPLIVGPDFVLVGFKPDKWAETLKA